MRLAGINNMEEANAWLPGYIADYNRRFAVVPKDPQDAHLPYPGTAEDLTHILSMQVERTLSKNLSCQHEGQLLQVATSGTGLGSAQRGGRSRGARVTLYQHFDGTQELRWRQRKSLYGHDQSATTGGRSRRQDGQCTGADKALAQRSKTNNKGHKPALNHPWKNMPIGKSATEGHCVTP